MSILDKPTIQYNGFFIRLVPENSTVTDEYTDEQITITDKNFAVKGKVIFCTEKFFKRIQEESAGQKEPAPQYVYCDLCKQNVSYWCEDTDHCSTYPHSDERY